MCFFVSFPEIGQFQKIVGGLMELMDELSKEVETEKMKVSPQAAFILPIVIPFCCTGFFGPPLLN